MVGEWQDNIKPFIKATERANESRKLKENIRLKTTGIKVDELASKSYIRKRTFTGIYKI